MSLNIKSDRAHRLAREVARRTGHTQTRVVEDALELLLHTLDEAASSRRTRTLELLADFDLRMTAAERQRLTTDALYDDRGLPA
jgi:antitoxin VapB